MILFRENIVQIYVWEKKQWTRKDLLWTKVSKRGEWIRKKNNGAKVGTKIEVLLMLKQIWERLVFVCSLNIKAPKGVQSSKKHLMVTFMTHYFVFFFLFCSQCALQSNAFYWFFFLYFYYHYDFYCPMLNCLFPFFLSFIVFVISVYTYKLYCYH